MSLVQDKKFNREKNPFVVLQITNIKIINILLAYCSCVLSPFKKDNSIPDFLHGARTKFDLCELY